MNKLFIANWKMFGSSGLACELFTTAANLNYNNLALMVPAPYLDMAQRNLVSTSVEWGAQTMHPSLDGAYTGDVSALMLKDFGCQKVLLGHSERRKYWHENDELIANTAKIALEHSLEPIICLGEPLSVRKNDNHLDYVKNQFVSIAEKIQGESFIIAYEPIWAIGTGETANCEQIDEMHSYLMQLALEFTDNCRIIYGGSVNEANISPIVALDSVAGVLVGGASLNKEKFVEMVERCKV